MSHCYACDDDATGTCDRSHFAERGRVPACERHRDDSPVTETDDDLRYQALEAWQKDTLDESQGAVSALCWNHRLLSPDEALEHVERTKTEALLCALYLLDEAGVSLPNQRAICAAVYADFGLQECEQVLRETETESVSDDGQ